MIQMLRFAANPTPHFGLDYNVHQKLGDFLDLDRHLLEVVSNLRVGLFDHHQSVD